jgi:hypothetical protein
MGDAKLIRRFCFTPINGIENQLDKSDHFQLLLNFTGEREE